MNNYERWWKMMKLWKIMQYDDILKDDERSWTMIKDDEKWWKMTNDD